MGQTEMRQLPFTHFSFSCAKQTQRLRLSSSPSEHFAILPLQPPCQLLSQCGNGWNFPANPVHFPQAMADVLRNPPGHHLTGLSIFERCGQYLSLLDLRHDVVPRAPFVGTQIVIQAKARHLPVFRRSIISMGQRMEIQPSGGVRSSSRNVI